MRLALWLSPVLAALLLVSFGRAAPSPSAAVSARAVAAAAPSAAPAASGAPVRDAGADAGAGEPADVQTLRQRAKQIAALVAGTLPPEIDPADLFDLDLDDERAIGVETERLQRVVARVDQALVDAGADAAAAVSPSERGADGGVGEAAAPEAGSTAAVVPDEALLAARLELDAARLALFKLPAKRREALLTAHAEHRRRSASVARKQQLGAAERERLDAKAQREKAEQQALRARTQAARAVADERVRLLSIKEAQASLGADLIRAASRDEQLLEGLVGARLGADKLIEQLGAVPPPVAEIDHQYDSLAQAAHQARESLRSAVAALGRDPDLPRVGADPLAGVTIEVDRAGVDRLRAELAESERKLLGRAETQRWDSTRRLWRAVQDLDARRLALLPQLSDGKRGALLGLGSPALGQARDELAQVALLVRYHLRESRRFVRHWGSSRETTDSALLATFTALQWLLPLGLLWWWRRRADRVLTGWAEAAREARHRRAKGTTDRSGLERAIGVFSRVHRAVEWLLLLWAVVALLPAGAKALLEVQLTRTTLGWLLGGRLAVQFIDALFAESPRGRRTRMLTAHLRLRSLRLIGHTVVGFGLVLAVAADLVGEGTIYAWVWRVCWLAVIPIFGLIVRWWREVIFQRVELTRKKTALLSWIEGHPSGIASVPAAFAGGAYLLAAGVARFVRVYVYGFDLTKRVLAYWFRREVEKQQADRESMVGRPQRIAQSTFEALSPEKPPPELVPSVADSQIKDVIERIREPGGAVYALVGERGSGKSSLLERIHERTPDTTIIACGPAGMDAFHRELVAALEIGAETGWDEICGLFNKRTGDNAVLVDDAHHLIRPVVGGFGGIDQLLEVARRSSDSCTWVFAFDAVPWQLFQRARETRPLFDDIIDLRPWSEEAIVRLIESRSREADVRADFSRLVPEEVGGGDDLDRVEALERARAGFYRLLWDFSQGNPAVALHYWRMSLRPGGSGESQVRLFQPPSADDLERLPDTSVFVMRAVVQFGAPTVEDIIEATMLDRAQVEHSLRYAAHRQYLQRAEGRYRVRWTWFRTITRFLVRRHLLMGAQR